MNGSHGTLDDIKIHVKLKLSALWTSVMFCYVYGDFFGLYRPGKLQMLLDGRMPIGPTTQGVLLGTAALMSIPSLMVFLSLVLRPAINRWVNVVFGALFTVIMLITLPGAWAFYVFLGVVEILLTASIVWHAWTWPRHGADST
jgi:Family of unknown function (DUF6326)